MRRLAVMALMMAFPAMGFAQQALIRLEAKRSPEAAARAAEMWAQKFQDVVTLPLSGGWTGIALGPLPTDQARTRLENLQSTEAIPKDAFVSAAPEDGAITPVTPQAAGAQATPDSIAVPTPASAVPEPQAAPVVEASMPPPAAQDAQASSATPAAPLAAAVAPVVAPPAPQGSYLRLQNVTQDDEARKELDKMRVAFPQAGLWKNPEGGFTIALGPLEDATAKAWLPVFRNANLIGKQGRVIQNDDLGDNIIAAQTPDLPAPSPAEPLPAFEDIQRALRWSGQYTGIIDGKDGPMTRAALDAEIATNRKTLDPGTAIRLLQEQRSAWRTQQGLSLLEDKATDLTLMAPLGAVQFDRVERGLSIYGPRNDSGAALILFSQPGGQQELQDLMGLVTALGWVPQPQRDIRRGHASLRGANQDHLGAAEGWVREGRAEGYVLIWPASDPQTHGRLMAEIGDSFGHNKTPNPVSAPEPVQAPASEASSQDHTSSTSEG